MDFRVIQKCDKTWASLEGEDAHRYCADCNLHVYDFAQIKPAEVKALVDSGERLCGLEHIAPRRTFFQSALALFAALPVFAQQVDNFRVTVVDATGAAVSGAKVEIGARKEAPVCATKTNEKGVAELTFTHKPDLELRIISPGFKTELIRLATPPKAEMQVTLQVGSVGGMAMNEPLSKKVRRLLALKG